MQIASFAIVAAASVAIVAAKSPSSTNYKLDIVWRNQSPTALTCQSVPNAQKDNFEQSFRGYGCDLSTISTSTNKIYDCDSTRGTSKDANDQIVRKIAGACYAAAGIFERSNN